MLSEEGFLTGPGKTDEVEPGTGFLLEQKMDRPTLAVAEVKDGSYFTQQAEVERFSSGCLLLDLVLGGGWAVGRVSNVVGDKSSSKCLREAYIQTPQGLVLIDDLAGDRPQGLSPFEMELGVKKGETQRTSHFYRKGVSSTIRIRTRHGYRLEVTPDHPVMVWTPDCQYVMRKAKDLKIGDVAVIVKSASIITKPYKLKYPPVVCRSSRETSSIPVTLPKEITEDVAYLFGLFVADGNCSKRNLRFSNSAPWFEAELRRILQNTFGITSLDKQKGPGKGISFGVSRSQLFYYLNYLLEGALERGFTARFKFVPKCILQSPIKVQAAFLRALIQCDSSFTLTSVTYCTASEQLANQVHVMLLNQGVVASRREYSVEGYEDHVYHGVAFGGRGAKRYLEQVGILGFEKLNPKGSDRSDFDVIPYLRQKLEERIESVRQVVGWSKNGKMTKRAGHFPKFPLKGLVDDLTHYRLGLLIQKFEPLADVFPLDDLKEILDNDFHYDPIIKLEVSDDPVEVYDVHIPNTHLFWSNGFISHNTGCATEAMINFCRKFKDASPRYREAESAWDDSYAEAMGLPLDRIQFGKKGTGPTSRGEESCETVEDWADDLSDYLKTIPPGEPGLYILDSLDALSDNDEMESEFGKDSYGAKKPKLIGQLFRRQVRDLERKRVHLMIISQLRDKIGVMFGERQTRTGGRALDFYASQIVWLANIGKEKQTKRGIERVVGFNVKAQCKKNKVGLPFRECEFPFRFGYGMDDVQACVDFLKEAKALNELGLGEKGGNAYALQVKALDGAEFKSERKRLYTAVRKIWREVEESFLPTKGKYE